MTWNFLYQITAASRTLTRGLGATAPRSPFSVLNWICWTSPRKKIPGYATGYATGYTGSLKYRIFVYIEFVQHSLTFDFPPLYSLWQNDGYFTRVKLWFACRWRTVHELLKTGYVTLYRLLPREAEATQHERAYQVLYVLYRALTSVRTVYILTTACGFYFDYRTPWLTC